jgi:hypothetical protein
MSVPVLVAPHVSALVSSLHARRRFAFEQILARIGDADPAGDRSVTDVTLFGRTFLAYFDGRFPYVVLFRIVRDDDGDAAFALVFGIEGPTH